MSYTEEEKIQACLQYVDSVQKSIKDATHLIDCTTSRMGHLVGDISDFRTKNKIENETKMLYDKIESILKEVQNNGRTLFMRTNGFTF